MAVETQTAPSEDRLWLARALLVLVDPRPVFAALRDDSEDAARARQEPVLALVLLAGIASILWTRVAGRYRTNRVLTLDERHFRALRTPAGEPFLVLPADA